MKKILLLTILATFFQVPYAQNATGDEVIHRLEERCDSLHKKQVDMDKRLNTLSQGRAEHSKKIISLTQKSDSLQASIDKLMQECENLGEAQTANIARINEEIKGTNASVQSNQSTLTKRTWWGVVIILVVLSIVAFLSYHLAKKIKKGGSSIDEVRKAQEAMREAQTRIQEESVKLDNKLLEIAERQMAKPAPSSPNTPAIDHSLTLKVADEIVRIEMNLSHMDPSVKGYKQLSKAVQRIKDNFNANGYEIIDMLGKPYNEGMKVVANFVADDSLEVGQQIVTGVTKPQINYNGQMIQAAQITVSQNI